MKMIPDTHIYLASTRGDNVNTTNEKNPRPQAASPSTFVRTSTYTTNTIPSEKTWTISGIQKI